MNSPPAHVVFTGGVTGGHVFPALAVAEQLRRRVSTRITFLGTERAKEREWTGSARIEHVAIPSAAFSGMRSVLGATLKNLRGYLAAKAFLHRERADVVVGLGGYGSAPTARAAVALGIPLILLEANAIPGRVTGWLAKRASQVCTSFESTCGRLPKTANVRLTGLPIRAIPRDSCLGNDRQIVVLGGSGGAETINTEAPKAIFRVRETLQGWRIVHQAGTRRLAETRRVYARLGLQADVRPFLDDLPRVLGESALAITRAGGSILAEIAAAQLPSVLVPFPAAVRDHQRRNAAEFARKTCCPVVDETDGPGRIDEKLADALAAIAADSRRYEMTAHLLGRAAHADAAARVADVLLGTDAAGHRPHYASTKAARLG